MSRAISRIATSSSITRTRAFADALAGAGSGGLISSPGDEEGGGGAGGAVIFAGAAGDTGTGSTAGDGGAGVSGDQPAISRGAVFKARRSTPTTAGRSTWSGGAAPRSTGDSGALGAARAARADRSRTGR